MTFIELVKEISQFINTVTLHPNFLFRGQADNEWPLEPSFTRIINRRKLNRKEALQLERECINKFSISALNLLPVKNTITLLPQNGKTTFSEWHVVMQHYSAPTRKLDWSCSPWVALYFACCEQEDSDASILIADFDKVVSEADKRLNETNTDFYALAFDPNSPDILHFEMAYNTNERLEAQQGRFSVCTNPLIDHRKMIEDVGGLHEITIPKAMKPEIMQELYKMNITAKTLYPGIDGLGKSTYEYCNLWDKNSIIK